MLTITYATWGTAISEFELEQWFRYILQRAKGKDDEVGVSTTAPFHRVRLAILTGEMKHTQVQFKFDDVCMRIRADATIENKPDGFLDFDINLYAKILTAAVNYSESYKDN